MTMPHPQAPVLVDAGNPLLSRTDCQLDTGSIETPDHTLGVITVRTPSTTLTVFLPAQDVKQWQEALGQLAGQLDSGGLVKASPQDLSLLAQLARKGRS
jgi:hypothetical protein